ncbi:MAG: ParB/RepB/Spo0J family partition protein [Gammaproteobacteria bacterium]|nr:ParB/RepB/Spo0J family partition protein [Gammaproteobacteria bacterium]NND55316.1 ParB/RepB/Spo0J family partition protein [Gammaproteobacteria bacterium]
MATKKTGLGRGLDALLGGSAQGAMAPAETGAAKAPAGTTVDVSRVTATPVTAQPLPDTNGLREIDLDQLTPGEYQPRRDMHKESLQELAASIEQEGVLQPISVRPLAGKASGYAAGARYEIIAGERRWRAAQMAGIRKIPAIVRDVDDEQAAAIALIENLQREDLNPLEEAQGLQRLIDEFDLTHQEAATAVGKSRAAVSNLIRLLELAPEVQKLLGNGTLSMGHARALLGLSGARSQAGAAADIVARGLSVRQTEALVKKLQSGATQSKKPAAPAQSADIRRLQDDLRDKLGAKVAIQHTAKGSGKLVISYNSVDELDGILSHLK